MCDPDGLALFNNVTVVTIGLGYVRPLPYAQRAGSPDGGNARELSIM